MTPLSAAGEASAFRLLTRVFLRRLIDNDLISPHGDRHDSLAVLCAWIVSVGIFVTFFLCVGYLAAFVQLPGPAALGALGDRFLFVAASIAIGALGALTVWDALGLEPRDAAILGPLPIAARTVSRAKLAAVAIFGAVLTLALNAAPSVFYPALLTLNIRGAAGATILRLMAAHATTMGMAGLFGFFGIIAIRGVFRVLLGEAVFRRATSGLQSVLVVMTVTALLLAPTVRQADVRAWIAKGSPRPAQPALWYLGLNETLAGHLVAETPVVLPPPLQPGSFPTESDTAARGVYRGLFPHLTALAREAWLALLVTMAVGLATYVFANRRLPDRASAVPGSSRVRMWIRRAAARHLRDEPEAQAGFFFAIQTLTRSVPHRTLVAVALAIGLTHAVVVLTQGSLAAVDAASTPLGWFGISTFSLTLLLAGISYAATVPADPGANWAIRMAWLGDERRYVAGVKRASLVLAIALIGTLLPLHIALFGLATALAHSLVGLLVASAILDAVFPSRTLPFACNHVPIANPKLVWPAASAAVLLVTYSLAALERWALRTSEGAVGLFLALCGLAVVVRMMDSGRRRRERRPIDFDGRPAPPTQRLGLLEHIAGVD